MTEKKSRLDTLDFLRGFAALYVVIHHLLIFQYSVDLNISLPLRSIFSSGYLGVDIFFILSGFVMAHAYRDRLGSPHVLPGYFISRFARLAPLYLVSLAALIPMVAVAERYISLPQPRFDWTVLPWSFLNLQGIVPREVTWNYPSWSISFEMIAYILLPFAIKHIRKFPVVAFALGMVVTTSFYIWIQAYHPTAYSLTTTGPGAMIRSVSLFSVGVALRELWDRPGVQLVSRSWIIYALLIIFPLGAVLTGWTKPWMVWLAPTSLLLFQGGDWLRKLPFTGMMAWLGQISFSTYLIHGLVEFVVGTLLAIHNGGSAPVISGLPALAVVGACLFVVLILGTASFHFIERPAQAALLGRFAQRVRVPTSA